MAFIFKDALTQKKNYLLAGKQTNERKNNEKVCLFVSLQMTKINGYYYIIYKLFHNHN